MPSKIISRVCTTESAFLAFQDEVNEELARGAICPRYSVPDGSDYPFTCVAELECPDQYDEEPDPDDNWNFATAQRRGFTLPLGELMNLYSAFSAIANAGTNRERVVAALTLLETGVKFTKTERDDQILGFVSAALQNEMALNALVAVLDKLFAPGETRSMAGIGAHARSAKAAGLFETVSLDTLVMAISTLVGLVGQFWPKRDE